MQGHSGPQSLHRQLHNETPVNTQNLDDVDDDAGIFGIYCGGFADAALR